MDENQITCNPYGTAVESVPPIYGIPISEYRTEQTSSNGILDKPMWWYCDGIYIWPARCMCIDKFSRGRVIYGTLKIL